MIKIPDGSEVYFDGKHYDADNFSVQDDESFYLETAKKAKGSVLEMACGTGRLTLPLAKAGIDIMGLDYSAPMLKAALSKAKEAKLKTKFLKADCRNFRIKKKFALIFFPFNSMQHLHDLKSLRRMFSRVREHLAPKGKFIVDVFNPNPLYLVRTPKKAFPIGFYKDPYDKKKILVEERYFYDKASQTAKIIWEYRKDAKKIHSKKLNMRCFFPEEFNALFYYNGFKIIEKYGSFDKKPFSSESQKQIIISRLQ